MNNRETITPPKIKRGDTIGIFCPSHVFSAEKYSAVTHGIRRCGFNVKLSSNIAAFSNGYAGSAKERADDLNELAINPEVKMVLFSGGDSAAEILPFVDFESIKANPKIYSSYSDATPILNAIQSMTGLNTYYGFGAGQFGDLRLYDWEQFERNFIEGDVRIFDSYCGFSRICAGKAEGIISGGYLALFSQMLASKYFNYDKAEKHILVLEDHVNFSNIGAVASHFAFIRQSHFSETISGMIFGHYSEETPPELYDILKRFGQSLSIPVIHTNDFGHGIHHAIFELGAAAELDADNLRLTFL